MKDKTDPTPFLGFPPPNPFHPHPGGRGVKGLHFYHFGLGVMGFWGGMGLWDCGVKGLWGYGGVWGYGGYGVMGFLGPLGTPLVPRGVPP